MSFITALISATAALAAVCILAMALTWIIDRAPVWAIRVGSLVVVDLLIAVMIYVGAGGWR